MTSRQKAVAAYLLMPLSSAAMLMVEKTDRTVRFHAWQGLILGMGLIVVSLLLSPIGGDIYSTGFGASVYRLVGDGVIGLGSFGLWAWLVVLAMRGVRCQLPLVGHIADRLAQQ
jgi:uncharacterized membrane protein